ncbi:MAG: class II aldolase/adducin family protein [Acidimicrobiaceae bacterium]|jgi:ribulose-5-phosphate 4-epimerase/fuculose-1-phosphate aldolase|nr:class II aldolase/adducin family protein [Acidimicrobiaceae bacterium]MBT5579050.1 class II aldolase/adducin family protein [Acidimicrobiaceae bacterium]MBT5849142.1 class II aldolase/adducin family protein [Acidimicrobiaceae bacterium]
MTDIQDPTETVEGINASNEPFSLPTPPVIEDVEAVRKDRKERLAAGLRILGRLHLAEGVAGHVTARDPEFTDHFWVNPFGHNFKLMTVSDLILVNHEGEVVEGDRPVNAAAFAIHSQLHQARPDVVAAAHTHAMYGRTFSTLGKPLKMITQDATAFYNDVALCSVGSGAVVVDLEIGRQMAEALGDRKALIHQNHGHITCGGSVDAAVWWYVALERCMQSQLVAEAAGDPIEIPTALCESGYAAQGHDLAGWFQFQPWWDELMRDDPGFLT